MKKKFGFLIFSLVAVLFMAACSDDDDDKKAPDYQPPTAVQTTFKQMFPNATNVLWAEKDDYGVASFLNSNIQNLAWFNQQGVWYLTETTVATDALPAPIATAIANSDYKDWKKADAGKLARKDMVNAYVVELTQSNNVVDLYFTEDGHLFATVGQDKVGNDAYPNPVDETILAMVNTKYPNAQIVNLQIGDNIRVTLLNGGVYFDYVLSKDYKWIQSEYAQSWADTPQLVKEGLTNDGYAFNVLTDTVTKLIRPQADGTITLYQINMHNSTGEATVFYDTEGNKVNG